MAVHERTPRAAFFWVLMLAWLTDGYAAAQGAQGGPWLFVPIAPHGLPLDRASRLTLPLETALVAAGGSVMSNEEAAARIRAEHSDEPPALEAEQLEALTRSLRDAQKELAGAGAASALPLLRSIEALPENERDALARDAAAAQLMEANCLTAVYLELRRRAPERAEAQAQLCRHLFPTLKPDPDAYPSEVLATVNAVERRDVRLEAPVGCRALLNGVDVGRTPLLLQVFPGPARLQFVCGERPTRVHLVRLGDQERLSVDAALDGVLHTERDLYLTGRDAVAFLQRWLGVRVVPLFVSILDGSLRVAVGTPSAKSIVYDLGSGYAPDDVSEFVEALRHPAPKLSPPRAAVAESSSQPPPSSPADTAGDSGVSIGPIALGAGGVVMLGTALVTGLLGSARDAEVRRFARACAAPCDPGSEQRQKAEALQSEVGTLYTATNILVVAGAVSVAGAAVWFLLAPRAGSREQAVLPEVGPAFAGARFVRRF